MERFFESKPVVYLSKFIDLVVLNILFAVCCIPVFTVGAAWTALYYTCVKVVRRDCGKIWQEYSHSFRDNFKTATAAWVCLLAALGALGVTIYRKLIGGSGTSSAILIGICMAVFLFVIAMVIYAFPILSRFTVNCRELIKNTVVLSIRHSGETISMIVLTLGLATLIVIGWKFLPLVLLVMPSIYTLLISMIMEKILIKYTPDLPQEDNGEENEQDKLYVEENKEKPWYLEGGDRNE